MVDLTFLESFTKGDAKKMRRYISLYLDVAPKTFDQMRQNLVDEDWAQLRIHAHSLKPQVDFMGITELKNVLATIEESCRVNKIECMSEQLGLAIEISENSTELLEKKLKNLSQ